MELSISNSLYSRVNCSFFFPHYDTQFLILVGPTSHSSSHNVFLIEVIFIPKIYLHSLAIFLINILTKKISPKEHGFFSHSLRKASSNDNFNPGVKKQNDRWRWFRKLGLCTSSYIIIFRQLPVLCLFGELMHLGIRQIFFYDCTDFKYAKVLFP